MARRDRDDRPEIEVLGVGSGRDEERVVALGSERTSRRSWVIGAAIVVVLLAVGLTTGGDSGEGDEGAPGSERPIDFSTSTTRRPRPTTTTIPGAPLPSLGPLVEDVDGWQLLAQVDARTEVLIDLETGEQVAVDLPSSGDYRYAVRGGVVRLDRQVAIYQPVPVGDEVELGPAESIFAGADPGTVWLVDGTGSDDGTEATLVDLAGRPLVGPLELDEGYIGYPTRTGFLTTRGGRVFHVTDGGTDHVASGSLLGTSSTAAVLERCDQRARCGLVLVDLDDGDERPVEGTDDLAMGGGSEIRPSDEGELVLVRYGDNGVAYSILDTGSGRSGTIEFPDYAGLLGWLPNRQGLLVAAQGDVLRLTVGEGGELVSRPLPGISWFEQYGYPPLLIPR